MFETLVAFFRSVPTEAVWLLALVFLCSSQLLLIRFWGVAGACVYAITAIIAANIEVLKTVHFDLVDWTMPGGTLLFTTTFLATDIISEHYGRRDAQKVVLSSLAGYLLFTLMMQFTIGYAPLGEEAAEKAAQEGLPMLDQQISDLFLPMPAFFMASMAAYLISQLYDVWFFEKLKERFFGRHLWLRNTASTATSSLLDNIVFSVLAWQVFKAAGQPFTLQALTGVILSTYLMRLLIAVLDTPFMYLSRYVIRPPRKTESYYYGNIAPVSPNQ